MREMVFVSHANPEDNEFAKWIALRLAAEGYPVWCDLTKLLGGELFWSDIEHAIRERTVKFLYVLTKASNDKPGARNELAVALAVERKKKLKDFVIPLWLDELSASDFNAELVRRNAIPFQDGWAPGLGRLLQKLEEDGVPKKATFGPSAVSEWWRTHASSGAGIRSEPEPLYSNWYPLEPTTLFFHELGRDNPGSLKIANATLPFPGVQHDQYLVAFAPAEDFRDRLGPGLFIRNSTTRRINDPAAPEEPRLWRYRDERNAISDLLRQAIERWFAARPLPTYTFSKGRQAFYFADGMLPDNRAWYVGYGGQRSWRAVVGASTLKGSKEEDVRFRYWHFSLEPRPTTHPLIGYTMKPHVLFSDDGSQIWDNKDRLHRVRRSHCKRWWNDRWRDLIAASVVFLADGADTVMIPVGSVTAIGVSTRPITLESPVSFDEMTLEAQGEEGQDDGAPDASSVTESDQENEGDNDYEESSVLPTGDR